MDFGVISAASRAAQGQTKTQGAVGQVRQQAAESNQSLADTQNTDQAGRQEKQIDEAKYEASSEQAIAQNEIKYAEKQNALQMGQMAINGLMSISSTVTGLASKLLGQDNQ